MVNADDFGFTPDVNAGIVHCHKEGILTSTTLMANGDAFDDAVRLVRSTPSLDVGCHLVLVQGRSLVTGDPLPATPAGLLLALAKRELNVYAELRKQIEKTIAVGIRPTHLDSHKHTHLIPAVFRVLARLAEEFGIAYVRLPLDPAVRIAGLSPLTAARFYRRLAARHKVQMTDHFAGFRLTGSLTEKTLAAALETLSEGTTELMCHPGFLHAELAAAPTRLKESRVRELEALTSPRIRELINEAGVRLGPFGMDREVG